MHRRFAASLLVLSLAACGGGEALPFSPSNAEVPVVVTASDLALDPGTGTAAVPFRIGNRSGHAIYLVRCGAELATALDRWSGADWVEAEPRTCPDGSAAGGSAVSVGLSADSVRNASRTVHAAGTYRVRVGTGAAPGAPLDWTAASAAFVVR